jgi:hypothetical protein
MSKGMHGGSHALRSTTATNTASRPPTIIPAPLSHPAPHTHRSWTLFQVTESMLNALTGCERILRTPCPPGYVGVLRAVVVIFLCLLPISLGATVPGSLMIIPVTMLASYAQREPNPHYLDHAPLRRCLPSPRGAGD